jgi:hypothetical protein
MSTKDFPALRTWLRAFSPAVPEPMMATSTFLSSTFGLLRVEVNLGAGRSCSRPAVERKALRRARARKS